MKYWLHVIFNTWQLDGQCNCQCWICKVVKWKA